MKIGFHLNHYKRIEKMGKMVEFSGGNVVQTFVRGLRGGKIQEPSKEGFRRFHEVVERRKIKAVVLHAPYIYNLASGNREDVAFILEDLDYAKKIRAPYYVLHPGYFKGLRRWEAIENLKKGLLDVLNETSWYGTILIKNMAGAGTELCDDLEEWNECVSFHSQVKGILDFARLYSSGMDFTSEASCEFMMEEVEEKIGWEKIKACLLNDSDRGIGSHKNQFGSIGEGVIGFKGYEEILSNTLIKEKLWIMEHVKTLHQMDMCLSYCLRFYKEGEQNE